MCETINFELAYQLGVGVRMTASLKIGILSHMLKQSSGTNPGQESEIRDCPGDSGRL